MKPETVEFLTAGLRPLNCRACGTCVLVKKSSMQHTSIQWTSDASRSCPVFAERKASGAQTALLDTCGNLGESIEIALKDGELEVPE
ncbi:hypothetical protein [Amycolatopsis azurea]|uniref:Ferredoxin n=1 Tax=Amycolatopsis azurea DSM 43854 TaxID=1238180 RepID=M2NR75_9PSEU|nr:hypothetical protein [Amycolatopsis azurea]EMD24819.1 hypothetical protein C791_5511 [Amycolatopsis azurea DSM 43854]OOC04328.1 hypothetical protein B0293_21080 [Amycolatopsis azurea DSM 43854]